MADIFISYSSQHRELTRELAAAIEVRFGAGSVWWDEEGLRGGDQFSREITRALDDAKAVVVVWTEGAVDSTWVYAEAVRAASQRKVVTTVDDGLDTNRIPLPFNVYHNVRARDATAVIAGIDKLFSGEASPLPSALPGKGFRGFLLDPKQETLPPHAIATRPASLLLAKHRLVPFDDFHGVRTALVQWATEEPGHALGRTALGRLVHAPAGLGKTRALIETADTLTKEHGWLAGFMPRDVRGAGRESSEAALERLILSGRDATGLMLIVDYAESRQADVVWLAEKLVQRAQNVAKPSRLVLLSRGSGVWWDELVRKSQHLQELFSLGGDAYDEVTIPEQIAPFDRRALFVTSVSAFRQHGANLSTSEDAQRLPSDDLVRAIEAEDDYDRPLAVQIAALLHVAGVDAAEGRQGMASLLDKILGLEYEHWDKVLDIAGKPNWQRAVRDGVALATLVGGIDTTQAAEALIARDPVFEKARDIDVPRVMHDLSLIFPAENDGLASLEPDLIGEHHVLEVLAGDEMVDACLDWAGENRERRQHILTVLNRATRAEHGAKASRAVTQLERLVKTKAAMLGGDVVAVAFETPGSLLELCRRLEYQVADLDEMALATMDDALPIKSLTFLDLSLSIARRRADISRQLAVASDAQIESESALDHFAGRLGTLARRLSAVGRHEEALIASQEAAEISRRVVRVGSDISLLNLAGSLNNVSLRLSDLGRHELALAVSQEAADITRRLTQMRPKDFLLEHASNMNNLGNRYLDLGRDEEALAASREALEIRRRAAELRPETYLSDLATSLNNISGSLSQLGRHEEAMAAIQEAVDIYRRLAAERPDAFLPDLGASLSNLGMMFSRLARLQEAVAISQEAVVIRRRLTNARLDAFLADLAASLNNFGIDLFNLDRKEEAMAATQEAVGSYRRLTSARPERFLPYLARSLRTLGVVASSLSRLDEARTASEEAVDMYRRLAQGRPDDFVPDLAWSLTNLCAHLSNLGRHVEALAASQEAVDINRRLAHERPDAFLPELARSVSVMSDALAALDRHPGAAHAASEALGLLAPFVERYPEAHGGLARTILDDVKRYSEVAGIDPDQALIERVLHALPQAGVTSPATH